MSDDYEYEEETQYIIFNIGKTITHEFIDNVSRADGGAKVTGLEEGEPYLQLGDLIFEGQVDETIGTHMVFEIEERKPETTGLLPLLSSIRSEEGTKQQQRYSVKYHNSTETIVKMDHVSLKPKTTSTAVYEEMDIDQDHLSELRK